MKNLNVYKTINSIPENANIISSRWIFKYKKNAQGQITKRKSRLVAKGFTQQFGIDYKDTYILTHSQTRFNQYSLI